MNLMQKWDLHRSKLADKRQRSSNVDPKERSSRGATRSAERVRIEVR